MTETSKPMMADDIKARLSAMLLAGEGSPDDLDGDVVTMTLRNPDGFEAMALVNELTTRLEADLAVAVEALETCRGTVQAFLDMVLVMTKWQALPIPAILERAEHNCPIVLGGIDTALARIKPTVDQEVKP